MSWWEVVLDSCEAKAQEHSEKLENIGALAVTFVENGDTPVLEPAPGDTPLWSKVTIKALFENIISQEKLKKKINSAFNNLDFSISSLEDQDWVSLCQKDFQSTCFGDKLWVVPSWAEPVNSDAITLRLDPGLAFGTGTHPTTSLCLSYLAKNIIDDSIVFDYGCGSGILGIASALLGATKVIAIDHDHQAITSTQDNAKQNNVANLIHTYHTSNVPNPLPTAHFVVANILSETLIQLKKKIVGALKPEGTLLMSGILREQAGKVISEYEDTILFEDPIEQEGWVLLIGKLAK